MRRDRSRTWSVDLRALAALRAGLGAIVLVDLAQRAWDYPALYGDFGLFPIAFLRRFRYVAGPLCLHALSPSPAYQALLFLIAAVCATLFLAGWRTRWATFFTWWLLLSIQLRNPLVLHAGDNLLRLLVMWCLFLPAGARWSVDALRAPQPPAWEPRVASAGTAALLTQVALVYWSTAGMKWQWSGWRTGEGLYTALASDFWTRAPAALLLARPVLLKPLGLAVLGFETVAPFFLFLPWPPVKDAAVAGFWTLQLGFGAFLYLGLFPWISAVAMLPFLSSRVWDRLDVAAAAVTAALRRRWRPAPACAPARWAPSAWETADWATLRALAVAAIMGVLIINEAETATGRAFFRWSGRSIERGLGLYTPWSMFVGPQGYGGWLVFAGDLAGGGEVDLRTGESPARWRRPAVVSDTFPDMRWAKFYFSALALELRETIYDRAAERFGREWNRRHPDRRVSRVRAVMMWRTIEPGGQARDYRPWRIGEATLAP